MELTSFCNHKCIHCCRDTNTENELGTEEIKDTLDQLANLGCLQVVFTGGEPLVRKDFFEIAEYAKRKGFSITLYSNGFLIPGLINRLSRLPLRRVEISLYGATQSTHESITGVAGSFDKTLEAINVLRGKRIPLIAKTLIMNKNLPEIERMRSMYKTLGINYMFDPLVLPRFNAGEPSPQAYKITQQELKDLEARSIFRSDNNDILKIRAQSNAGKLYDLLIRVSISSKGEVYPSLILRMKAGDLRKQRLKDIWDSSPVFRYLHSLTLDDFRECSKCGYLSYCPLCIGLSYLEKRDLLEPSRQLCNFIGILYKKRCDDEEKEKNKQEAMC
jgi:radical SAM protein with 4Fe4S-binding SPASM domain